MDRRRADLLTIYRTALLAVNGRRCINDWLTRHPDRDFRRIVAIGKAAAAMTAGALDVLGDRIVAALVITRQGYTDPGLTTDGRVRQFASGHPLPDQRSLTAGRLLLDFLTSSAAGEPILFLISGGTSALVEVPAEGVSLVDLQRSNTWLLGSGLGIASINAVRIALSAIKGGGLVRYLAGRPATVLLLSDVPGDDPAIIGSGLLYSSDTPVPLSRLPDWLRTLVHDASRMSRGGEPGTGIAHHVIADASLARRTACRRARSSGYTVVEHDHLITGDIRDVANDFADILNTSPPALHIWSGEPTVVLPEHPGTGGRCQSLALAVALALSGSSTPWWFLAGGSDGSDGPGTGAGALVDAASLARIRGAGFDARHCLLAADAGPCLRAAGDLLITGPTGTNVMDIMLGLRC